MASGRSYRRVLLSLKDVAPLETLGFDPETVGTGEITSALARFAAGVKAANARVEKALTRADWMILADLFNGQAEFYDGGTVRTPVLTHLVASLSDAHALDRLGDKWFGEHDADVKVKALRDKLQSWGPLEGEAILVALRWFWGHADGIDAGEDPWFRASFRVARSGKR